MKIARGMMMLIGLMCLSGVQYASGKALGKDEILEVARAHVESLEWAATASYEVKRGVGHELSQWFVVVSCTTCLDVDELGRPYVFVLAIARSGKINCAVMVGTYRCSKTLQNGGKTSQSWKIRDGVGNVVKINEEWETGGGRVIKVKISRGSNRK